MRANGDVGDADAGWGTVRAWRASSILAAFTSSTTSKCGAVEALRQCTTVVG